MNQPILSDTSATVIVQNTLKPPNDNPIQEGNILNEPGNENYIQQVQFFSKKPFSSKLQLLQVYLHVTYVKYTLKIMYERK